LFNDEKKVVCIITLAFSHKHSLLHSWVHSLGRWPCSEGIAEKKLSLFYLLTPKHCALNVVSRESYRNRMPLYINEFMEGEKKNYLYKSIYYTLGKVCVV